jgi:hypothetical protein
MLFLVMFGIQGIQSQNVTVSGAVSGNGSYATLSAAFTAIGTSQAAANITVTITGDTTEPAAGASIGAGTWTSLTIQPSGGLRTVSGAATAGNPLLLFNGADNVTISGGGNLVISNTTVSSTSNTSTIRFIGDATNNIIDNCTVLGSTTVPTGTNGGVIFFSTGTTTGNDNNTISNCNIGPAGSNLPSKLIYGNGSTTNSTIANSNITIDNCRLYDYFLAGGCAAVYASTGNTNWNVTNNKIYQTASRTITGTMYGVYFSNSTYGDNVQITGNTIGYASNSGTGTTTVLGTGTFYGVSFTGQSSGTNPNNINNNTISDISFTSGSGAIYGINNSSSASANTVNINGNTIKNITVVGTTGACYMVNWSSATNLSVSNNNVYNITRNSTGTMYGLYSGSSSVNETVSGNTVRDISNTGASSSTIYGIYQNTSSGTKLFQNNTVYNLTGNGGMSLYGINVNYGTTLDISGNTVYGLTNTGGTAGTIYGIGRGSSATTVNIFKNKVYGLSTSSTGGVMYGIYIAGGTTTNTYNNIVGGMTTSASNASLPLVGIYISGGTTSNVYYNTVRIPASSGATLFGSAALYASSTPTIDLRNNILVNNSTAVGAATTSAYRRSSSTLTTHASTSNNNLFYGSTIYTDGTSSDATLGDFITRLGDTRESVSKSQNITFASTTGSDANFLNFNTGAINFAGGGAQVLASPFDVDFSGASRSGSAPDMGAFEFAEGSAPLPNITSFSPLDLCVAGGQSVTITGTDLGLVTTVGFNGPGGVNTLFGIITAQTSTSLTVTTPAGVVDGVITATNSTGSDNSSATFVSRPTPTVTVSSNVTICSGSGTSLVASGGATYSWSPATGLSATTGATVTASPTSTTTYTVTGTSTYGCSSSAQVTVTVNKTPSAITVSKTPSNICAGGITTLTATGGTIGSSGSAVIGTGTTTSSTTSYPNPFSAYYGGVKHQMLIPQSELTAQGLTVGSTISSVTFSLSAFAANACTDLTIRMGTTTDTALTGFVAGTTTVYNSLTFTPSATGPITFTLNTPFVWSGNSLVVEVVHNAGNTGNGSGTVTNNTTTAYNSVFYGAKDSVAGGIAGYDALSSWTSTGSSANRPNMTFGYSSFVPTVFSWSPTTDLYSNAGATAGYTNENQSVVYSKGSSPVTYTVTSANSLNASCTATQTITVSPNALPTITVTPSSATICNGGAGTTLTASGGINYVWSPALGLDATNTASVLANPTTTTTYTVSGSDSNDCSNTTTVVVTVNEPVVITAQPDNQVVLENASATFTVAATGTGLSYQWKENGVDISGANSATYVLDTATSAENGYLYTCEVSGASPCTPVLSDAATLTVGSVSITSHPSDQTICSNSTATFAIGTSGTVTSYQWEYSTNGTSWFDVSGEVTDTLVLSGLTSANSNTYFRCVINGTIASNSATLVVYDVLAITTQPTSASVCIGTASVSFTTAATGSGVAYQWQFSTNGGSTWTNVASGGTSATYTVTAPTASLDNYQYKAIVTGVSPCAPLTTDVATLRVIDVVAAASSANICIGQSVTLSATFTGSPASATSSWVCTTTGSGAETAVSGTPAVITPTALGTYVYTYTSTGDCSFTKTVTVTVNGLPTITSATATPASVCSDATINLAAQSIGISSGSKTIGTQASTSLTGGPYRGGSCTANKVQYLIPASELLASGVAAGNITSLTFVTTSTGSALPNFTISMGATALTAMTTNFVTTGLTEVYNNASYTPVSGNNLHTFSVPFNWNGTSNIIVSVCHDYACSSSGTMSLSSNAYAATSYLTSGSSGSNCTSTTGATTTTTRPVMIFAGQVSTNLTSNYTWSWNSTPAVTAATGTTSVTNSSGAAINQTFTATATSGVGCSSSLTTSAVQINTTLPAPTGTSSSHCGSQTPTCSVTGTGVVGRTFKWYLVSTGGTALAGQTASTLSSYPVASTTTFYVSEVTADGLCESPRTAVTVTVTAPYAFTLSASTATNCSGSASLTPVTIATNPGGYTTFNWTNSATVSGNSTSGWTFSPTTTTTYVLTASDGICSTTASVVVTPTALPVLTATAVPASICVGASSTLTALTQTIAAGNATIGSGATTSSTYSNPFYSLWSNIHTQHIILASELTGMGLKAGNITSVALDVTSAGTLPMIDLSVKIGTTAATNMSSFVSNAGFQTVYTNASLLPTVGVNTLTFSTPFNWDGTSNLVLEFCHGNGSSSATMSRTVKADNTAYVSSIKAHVSSSTAAATICGDTTTNSLTYSVRPQFIFGGQVATQGVGTLAYTWNDPSTTTGNVLTVSPTTTTTYTVSGYNSGTGCTGTATGTVTVYTEPTAPTATSAIQCGTAVPSVSVADTNGFTTPVFKWYADNVTTTALQSSTSTTYTTSVSATTTFYVSVVSPGGCESPRVAVTTTVVTPATLTISPAVTICSGSSAPLTVSGAVSYVWSPATGLDSTSGASVNANPTTTTTYTATGTDSNNCTSTASVTVTVQPAIAPITAGASSATVCSGANVNLTASSFDAISTQTESFESYPTAPADWTFINAGSGNAWGYSTSYAQSGSKSLSYSYNSLNAANAWAITPVQNLVAGKTYTISYWYRTTSIGALYPENLKLTVGTAATNAAQTTVLLNQSGLVNETFAQATATFTPSTSGAYYFGLNCYSAANQNGLFIDDFTIASPIAATYAWSSVPSGFTSSAQNPTNVAVPADTTFSVTATNGACTSTSSVAVTTTPLTDFTLTDVTICNGGSANLVIPEGGMTYTWSPATGLNTTSGGNVTASPTATTTYTVTGVDDTTLCPNAKTVTVTVSEPGALIPGSSTTSRTIVPGQVATFTVATVAGPTYTYLWQVSTNGGTTWTSLSDDYVDPVGNYEGSTTATLSVHNADETFDQYQYQCIVTGDSPCTSLTPIVATLTISNTGFASPPASVTLCGTTTANFAVVTSGDEPYGIQWQMSTDNGVTYLDIVDGTDIGTGLTFLGTDTLSLDVSDITVANTNTKFLCVLNFYLPSNAATLTVKNPVAITAQPVAQSVCATGGTATYSVTATGDDLTYQWQMSTNGGTSYASYVGAGATTASIAIVNPALGANGNLYRVIVSGNAACSSVTSASALLNINNPTITSQPTAKTVVRGASTTYTVAASVATAYQWQYSTNGSTGWANVVDATPAAVTYTGATSATLTIATLETTPTGTANFYRCVVTNDGCTVNSNAAQLTVTGYCTPAVATSTLSYFDEFSTSGGAASINNTSSGFSTDGYGNFTAQTTTHVLGTTVNYSTVLVGTTVGVAIWVDWNQNGTFETTERVANTTSYTSTFAGSFTVPMTATLGTTRMRIMLDFNNSNPTNPCGPFGSGRGEVEDYTITILPIPPCSSGVLLSGTAIAANDTLCSGNSGTTVSLTGFITGYTGITYQWEYSTNGGTTWNPAVGASATTTALSTGAISADTMYRCVTTCSAGGSVTSTTASVVYSNPLIATTTPAGRCGTGTVTLAATSTGATGINWYAAATGGSALGTGTSFVTPSISSTTTYYAEAVNGLGNGNVGLTSNATTTNGTSSGSHGIMITTTAPNIKIESVAIPFTGTGTFTIALKDATNTTVISSVTSSSVTGTGLTLVNVPINLIVANAGNYTLIVNSVSGTIGALGYSTGTYPYTALGGAFSVTNGYWYGSSTSNMYLYNLKVSSGCASARTAVVATVDALPTATISYATPFCSTGTTASVTQTGTTGGSYSSTAGLDINPSTGEINIAGSTPGTYTVTYTMLPTTYCTAQTATTSVTINQAPTSTYTYDFAAYCTNGGTVTPTITGATGTFTATPAGLTINPSTGVITLATSAQGTYTVTNTVSVAGCPNSTTNQTVTVNTAVAISSQPVSVSKLPTENATFSVTASGTGIGYQWQVSTDNGSTWTNVTDDATYSGATTASLTASNVDNSMNQYQYQVLVSGATACATVTSSAAILTVSSAAIVTNPANFTACSAGATTATFAITTSGTVTSYQWEYSTNGGSTWATATGGIYSGDTTDTLTLTGVTLGNNNNQFRCVVNGVVVSNAGTLTVNTAVSINTPPVATTACSGGTANFSVAASGTGLSYQWQFSTNGGSTWANTGTNSNTLTLAGITAGMNNYQYQVVVSGAAPCSAVTSTPVVLTVNTAVAITTQPVSTLVCANANASFSVVASGTSPTYLWEMSTNGGSTWTSTGITASTLSLTAVTTAMNNYQYRAVVSGAAPCTSVTSSAATLTVNQPVAPTVTPASANFCPNGIVTLTASNLASLGIYSNGFNTLPANFATSVVGSGTPTAVLSTTYFAEGAGSVRFNTTSTSANVAYGMNANVDLSTAGSAKLTFSHQAIMEGSTTSYDYGYVEYSTNGGSTWVTFPATTYVGTASTAVFTGGNNRFTTKSYPDWITAFTSSSSVPSNTLWKTETFNIPAAALTNAFRVRFRYTTDTSTNYYGWMLDNVKITSDVATWTPTTGLYTNAAATNAYTGGNAAVVYAKPLATSTYTVTTTNGNGCSNSSNVTLTLLPAPTMTGISQPATTCSGSNTTFNVTGLAAGSTSTLSYNINGGGTQTVTGVVADGSGNGSFTLSLAAFTNGQTLTVTSIQRTDNTPSCATTLSSGNTVVISVQPLVTYFQDSDSDGYGNNAVSTTVCTGQPVGYVTNNTDCDDMNNAVYQSNMLYTDVDGDGYTVGAATLVCYGATLPAGTSLTSLGTDCDDNNNAVYQSNMLYVDVDGDGYTVGTATSVCYGATLPAGTSLTTLGEDCNDNDNTLHTAYTFYIDADEDGYGSKNAATVCAIDAVTPPIGYTLDNSDCNDADPLTWQENILYIDVDGDGWDAGQGSICYGATIPAGYSETTSGTDCNDNAYSLTNVCSSEVNITMFIEGYYTGSGTMASVKNNQDYVSPTTEVEDLTVELHDATTYALVASTTATLNTDGTMTCTFATAPSGSFYIVVKGSNIVETWSADPQTVGGTPLSYDFTSGLAQAYTDGSQNSMIEVEPGVWAFYSGDVNQDGSVDGSDAIEVSNASDDALYGVEITDLNGDGAVDGSDAILVSNNSDNAIYSQHP